MQHPETNPNPMNLKTTMALGASELALRASMTPAERAAGRFMRAPDHDAGAGGEAGGAGGDAAAAAAAAAEAGKEGGEGGTGAAGSEAEAGKDEVTHEAGKEAEAGKGADGSIAGDAGAGKAGEGEEGKIEVLGAPEAYDVKVPAALAEKGMTFDKEVFDLVEPDLRALNLSNDAAQALVGAYAEKVVPALVARGQKQAEEAQATEAARVRKEWADASRADPEIGGANFDKTVDACAQVWDKFGIREGTGLRLLLNESGLGNHPDLLRFLSRVAKVTGEGKFISSDGAGGDKRPIWDRIYGQPEPAEARK